MKSEKGVTLMSLATYIVLMLIVIAILTTVSMNFQSNLKQINEEGTEVSEISKFNMYFLQEVKKQGNNINSISNNEISFTTGNKYVYKANKIYLENGAQGTSIIIASDIIKCEFNNKIENGKDIVIVTIQANNTNETINEYVLNNEAIYFGYEDEETYIDTGVNTEIDTEILPSEYQQVEYVTFQNDDTNGYNNCINTLVKFSEADKIEFTYKSVDTAFRLMFIAGYDTSPDSYPYLADAFYQRGFTSIITTPSSLSRGEASNGTQKTINLNYISESENYISFGSWIDVTWSRTIDWYSFKIWNGDTKLRDFIPCYRKSDTVAGMYDIVNKVFYTNCGTGQFLLGPEK